MNYVNYEKAIMLLHGVKIVGWPLEAFISLSDVTNVIDIRKFHDAWKSGACKWVRLTTAELNIHAPSLEEREKNGEAVGKPRKKRSDAGVMRGKRKQDDKENAGPSAKRSKGSQRGAKKAVKVVKAAAKGKSKQPTSAEFINSSDEEDWNEGGDGEENSEDSE
jgi:hypothetical protein